MNYWPFRLMVHIIPGISPEKNDPHIRIPAAFPKSGWGKLSGYIQLDLKGLTSHQVRCKSAIFWKTER
jgi:hypothetical protein